LVEDDLYETKRKITPLQFKKASDAATALVYTSLDYKDNLMVTVVYTQNQAVIQFMLRN